MVGKGSTNLYKKSMGKAQKQCSQLKLGVARGVAIAIKKMGAEYDTSRVILQLC